MLFLIDRVGRRILLLTGAVLSGLIHFITAAIMATYGHPVDSIGGKHRALNPSNKARYLATLTNIRQ
jgi:hypothetical protein